VKYYPAYLDMRSRPCLVIGGGTVAERKTLTLLEAGADITIVSPTLTLKLMELTQSGKITYRKKNFEEKDLSGVFLVIAATDSPDLNSIAALACKKKHILVNVVVPPDESSFIVPSVVERGDLLIAVSTGGISPALAKKIRQEFEAHYGAEYTLFLEKLAKVRKRVLDEVPDDQNRRTIFQALVDSDVIDLLKQGRTHEADQRIAEISRLEHSDG
jgi:precorrin-2 dehydrogenase / sirohydrochlorin ferrochelatase